MEALCDYCGNILNDWDFMTECGHIICGSICYNKYKPKCPICKKTTRFVLIGEKMPANGIGYLRPVRGILQDAESILSFRIKTMSQLVRFLRNKIHKQKEILSRAKQELSRIKEYKWEIHHLKQQNEYLEKELQKYAHTN
ncbi:unnamed protein product [Mucor hiemalis]